MTKVKKILCFLLMMAVCISAVGAFAFALDADVVVNLQIPENQNVYPGDEVSIVLGIDIDENTEVKGVEVDMAYSSNMPDVTAEKTADTMGWGMFASFTRSKFTGFGYANSEGGYLEGTLTFTVPDNAEPDEEYVISISDVIIANDGSYEESGTNYSIVNDVVTITVLDFPDIENVSVSGYSGEYDGEEHSLDVSIPSEADITYGTEEGNYKLSSLSYKDAGDYTVYYQITQDKHKTITGSEIVSISQKSLTSDMISDIDDVTYTGSQIKPEITVSDGSPSIISDSDYSISYGENINVGSGTVTITAEADGNYTGSASKAFNILKADMVYAAQDYTGTYDGAAHTGSLTVTTPAVASLAFGTVEGTYSLTDLPEYTNAGTYVVYYKAAADNYNDLTGKITITVNPKELTESMVSNVSDVTYTGSKFTPEVTVSDGNLLTADDYTVSYGDNTNVADGGSVTVTGRNNYTGGITKTFAILPIDFAEGEVTAADYSGIYDGAAHTGYVSTTVSGAVITYGETAGSCELTSAPVYTNAGTYTVYFKVSEANHNDYTGSFTVAIAQKELTEAMVTGIEAATYTGSQLTPGVTVADGSPSIITADDYTVSYGTNVTVAEGGSVTLTGKGNYTGTVSKSFEIARAEMTVSAENYRGTYDGTAHSASVVVSVPASAAVSYGTTEGTYDLAAMPSYTNAGTYTVYYTATDDNYITVSGSVTVTISPKEVSEAMISDIAAVLYTGSQLTPTVTVTDGTTVLTESDYTVGYGENVNVATGGTVSITGTGNYTGTASKAFTILPINFAEGEVTAADYSGIYDGAAHSGAVSLAVSTAVVSYGETADSCTLASAPAYTNAGTYTVYYSVSDTNHNTSAGSFTVTIAQKELTEAMITGIASAVYTGSQLTPSVTVTDGRTLVENTDYTVSYGENINVAAGGTLTVTGKGNYTGTVSKSFDIARADMTVSAENYSGTYDGTAHSASVVVSVPTSAAVSYGTAEGTYDLTSMPSYTNAGTYTVYYIAADDNYNTASGSATVTISPKAVSESMISDIASVYYTGSQLTPAVTVTDGTVLAESTDYTVGYGENINVATGGTVAITGTGNYTGTASKSFTILPIDFDEGEVTAENYSGTYDGAAHSGAVSSTVSTASVTYGETTDSCTLTTAPAYTNAGTYTVYYSVSDTNHNTITDSFTVTIAQKALTEDMVTGIAAATYTGSQLTPSVTVTDGTALVENTDYTVSYGENINVAAGGTLTVTGIGNYTGTVTKTFEISKADITVSAENYSGIYDGAAHSASVTVSAAGAAVSYGTAEGIYDLTAAPAYTNVGTYTVYYKATADNYNDAAGSVTISITAKTVTADMIGDIPAVTYTGSQLTPAVSVTDGTILAENTDYTVSYGENINVSAGGTVSITGTGNYTGTASKAFTISKAVLTASAESLTITYGETPSIAVSYTGFVGSDTENVIKTQVAAESLSGKLSAGTYEIVLSGASADNYDFTYSTGAVLTVNKKSVSITALHVAAKTYDGTTSGEIDADSVVFDGVLSGDDVTVTASSVVYESAEVGSDIAVVISGISLSGADAANYTLAATTFETTGTISEKAAEPTTETTTVKTSSSSGGGGGGSGAVLYTIKFETNGGSEIANKSASKNSTLQTALKNVADPEKEGCTFEGWYTDEDLTEAVDLSSRLTANITLYAKWSGEADVTEATEESVEATTEEAAEETETQADNRIIMTIDSVMVNIFGEESEIDVPPIIVNSRTMLPARFVLESLGAELDWDAANKKVTITKDDMEIIIYIGSETAYINGEEVTLDSPAFISNDRTYLPVRFISEGVGANVEWNEADRQVIITP